MGSRIKSMDGCMYVCRYYGKLKTRFYKYQRKQRIESKIINAQLGIIDKRPHSQKK